MDKWLLTDEEIAEATWSSHRPDVLKGEVRDTAIAKAQAKKVVKRLDTEMEKDYSDTRGFYWILLDIDWQALRREVLAQEVYDGN